ADLDSALATPPNTSPALFVLATERGGPIKYTGPMTIQDADVQLSIVLMVRSAADERHGAGAKREARLVIAQLRRALIGWTPDEAFAPLAFYAGRDDRYSAGWYAGQQIFASGYRIQNQPTD
ncbi:MAG TPA: hypothetical protein VGC79_17420, partial [Polyangiaceae bacterium]